MRLPKGLLAIKLQSVYTQKSIIEHFGSLGNYYSIVLLVYIDIAHIVNQDPVSPLLLSLNKIRKSMIADLENFGCEDATEIFRKIQQDSHNDPIVLKKSDSQNFGFFIAGFGGAVKFSLN